MIHHIVDLVQPLAWITSKRMLVDKLGGRRAAELARKHILHLVQHIVRMLGSERN
jgi:hypothetical protein